MSDGPRSRTDLVRVALAVEGFRRKLWTIIHSFHVRPIEHDAVRLLLRSHPRAFLRSAPPAVVLAARWGSMVREWRRIPLRSHAGAGREHRDFQAGLREPIGRSGPAVVGRPPARPSAAGPHHRRDEARRPQPPADRPARAAVERGRASGRDDDARTRVWYIWMIAVAGPSDPGAKSYGGSILPRSRDGPTAHL